MIHTIPGDASQKSRAEGRSLQRSQTGQACPRTPYVVYQQSSVGKTHPGMATDASICHTIVSKTLSEASNVISLTDSHHNSKPYCRLTGSHATV